MTTVMPMEAAGVMGRVTTAATIENLMDLWDAGRGWISGDAVRRVEVPNTPVNTGATSLSLPARLIRELGLAARYEKPIISSVGAGKVTVDEAIGLTIQGRECSMDAMEVPDDVPVLIGQLPLEHLDFVVDPKSRTLIGNPAHGGENVYEFF